LLGVELTLHRAEPKNVAFQYDRVQAAVLEVPGSQKPSKSTPDGRIAAAVRADACDLIRGIDEFRDGRIECEVRRARARRFWL
jgi:hypothetical protein